MNLNTHLNLLTDLGQITRVPSGVLSKLKELTELLISNYAYEKNCLQKHPEIHIDLGIGTLTLKIEQGEITYDFIPSVSLEKKLIKTLSEEMDPLEETVIQNLSEKILTVYKELI